MEIEYTFVMIRPGAIRREVDDNIIDRILDIGLTIELCERKMLTEDFINEHYAHLRDGSVPADVFERAKKENLSGEVIGLLVSGEKAIARMRILIGPGNVKEAREKSPNCIRAGGSIFDSTDNLIHASDSQINAIIECKRFFDVDITDTNQFPRQLKKEKTTP